MAMRLFLIYVLVELAVVVALVSTIGFGWTLLAVVGTFAVGLAVAGSQVKRQVRRLQGGLVTRDGGVSDGALVALGSILTVVPGLVTSAVGLLLLLPATRPLARPAVTALAARGLGRMPLIMTTTAGSARRPARAGEYVDGEVVDVTDVAQPSLPEHPDVA